MANQNGKKYGLTALFPIKAGEHAARLRTELRSWDAHPRGSPLSEVPVIHMARFVIIDRLAYQGVPAERDDLRSAYLQRVGVGWYDESNSTPEGLRQQLQRHFDVVLSLLSFATPDSMDIAVVRLEAADDHC